MSGNQETRHTGNAGKNKELSKNPLSSQQMRADIKHG